MRTKPTQTQRLEAIRQELLRADEVSIDDLAGRFNVSGMTIRRDLELLESRGDVVRTHGREIRNAAVRFLQNRRYLY